jgi:membrane protein DedA with SNARE-associated domain
MVSKVKYLLLIVISCLGCVWTLTGFIPYDMSLKSGLSPQVTLTSIQDSASIDSATNVDSLDKMLPYLDEMKSEADSQKELIFIYALVILLSTWFSEDLACIGAGILVANGFIPFWPATFSAILGILIGDLAFYLAGRILGTSVFEIAPFKWFIKKAAIDKTISWFNRKGPALLIISRFIPGSRVPVYLSAGILKTSFWRFLIYFGGTTLIWTPIFIWISKVAGNELFRLYDTYDDLAIWLIIPTILILWGLYKLLAPLFTVRGRRVLAHRLRRFFNSG